MSQSEPAKSSWTWQGEPLPFVRFDADEEFYRTFDKTRLHTFHERALEDEEVSRRSRIPIERLNAQLLLLSGTADGTWPADLMADTLVQTFREVGKASQAEHLSFEYAGHAFFVPGLPANQEDGIRGANAYADKKAWGALRRYLGLC